MAEGKKMLTIYYIAPGKGEEDKGFWNKIGVAFVNADNSLNLKFDMVPADFSIGSIQIREPKPKEEK